MIMPAIFPRFHRSALGLATDVNAGREDTRRFLSYNQQGLPSIISLLLNDDPVDPRIEQALQHVGPMRSFHASDLTGVENAPRTLVHALIGSSARAVDRRRRWHLNTDVVAKTHSGAEPLQILCAPKRPALQWSLGPVDVMMVFVKIVIIFIVFFATFDIVNTVRGDEAPRSDGSADHGIEGVTEILPVGKNAQQTLVVVDVVQLCL